MFTKQAFMQWFQDQIQSRWPKCVFTAVQLEDWYRRLRVFDDAALIEAVRGHYTHDEPRRPSLKSICERALQYRSRHTPTAGGTAVKPDGAGVPAAHTFIQCVARDADGRGPVGWFVPVLLWPFHRTYTRAMFEKAADHQRTLHVRSRGGVWAIVTAVTEAEMRTRQYRLTGQHDRIRKNSEKVRTPG